MDLSTAVYPTHSQCLEQHEKMADKDFDSWYYFANYGPTGNFYTKPFPATV